MYCYVICLLTWWLFTVFRSYLSENDDRNNSNVESCFVMRFTSVFFIHLCVYEEVVSLYIDKSREMSKYLENFTWKLSWYCLRNSDLKLLWKKLYPKIFKKMKGTNLRSSLCYSKIASLWVSSFNNNTLWLSFDLQFSKIFQLYSSKCLLTKYPFFQVCKQLPNCLVQKTFISMYTLLPALSLLYLQ